MATLANLGVLLLLMLTAFAFVKAVDRLTMVSRVRLVVFVLMAALSCRRDPSHLDEVQRMAYAVKPAVVERYGCGPGAAMATLNAAPGGSVPESKSPSFEVTV